jgi:iron complex outermembrane receptor protein
MGRQRSGITWDGIDLEQYYIDRRYNGAGKYKDDEGNTCYYGNQTDNYAQHHVQLNYSRVLSPWLTWMNTLNYTRGDGFDEYYKRDRELALYGFSVPVTALDGSSVDLSDVIYRKRLNNDYYVLHSGLRYRGAKAELNGGVNLSRYDGEHFGELLWVRALGDGFDCAPMNADYSWYRSDSRKHDISAFLRGELHPVPALNAYADLQYRRVVHHMAGLDDDRLPLDFDRTWDFFNPRAGVSWHFSAADRLYGSAALGHREPGRGDIKDNLKGGETPIRPEKMLDVEMGYQHDGEAFTLSANLYLMEYWDILLETGRLNASGYAVKENMPRAWRRGAEFAAAWRPSRWLRLDANTTLSINQIDNYVSYVSDGDGATIAVPYGRTTMLMSPSLVGMARATALPWKGARLALDAKYVGKQFLDNSMREELAVPAYWIADLEIAQQFHPWGRTLEVSAYVHNLFNRLYYASGWRWESWDGEKVVTGAGVYPQAPVNGMLRLSLVF